MVDESQELRRVSWTELFSFTHIFKTWRMARHYSKLVLAFAAIALVCLVGWVMDAVWGWTGATAHVGDVVAYHQAPNRAVYGQRMAQARREADEALVAWRMALPEQAWTFEPLRTTYRDEGGSTGPFAAQLDKAIADWQETNPDARDETPERAALARRVAEERREVWKRYRRQAVAMLQTAERLVETAGEQAAAKVEDLPKRERPAAEAQLRRDVGAAERALWKLRVRLLTERREALFGRGIFEVLVAYEGRCLANACQALGDGRIFTGAGRVLLERRSPAADSVAAEAAAMSFAGADDPDEQAIADLFATIAAAAPGAPAAEEAEPVGLVGWLILMVSAVVWLAGAHWLYAIVFGLLALSIWALFGGAVARIAALHAAQETTVPMGEALKFSANKFFSFITAPLIMLAIIFLLGLLLGFGGLLSAIPYVGAVLRIVFALLFGLVLIIGAAITFMSIGLLAGFPLMYPAIAVEGSDSFDAISRSFSYVFGRPWRYGLYLLVSAVYGTICYLFVRLFAYGTLLATHVFVARGFFGLGLSTRKAPHLAEGAGLTDLLWGRPTFGDLSGEFHMAAIDGWWNLLTAWILRLWVYVVVGLVAAFVLSFAVSAFTNIYYLLRRKVDATDLDDVYVEEIPEDYDSFETEPADAEDEPSKDRTSTDPGGQDAGDENA